MPKMMIWNRELNIDTIYDVYNGEDVLSSQKDALDLFLKDYNSIIEPILDRVKSYCIEINGQEIGSDRIDNIFRYVIPKALYIKRSKKDEHIVALLCDYRFNPDDGLAIVFKNNELEEIGTENIIL